VTEQTLTRKGYQIKNSSAVGWWVDGACGYAVAAYFDTKEAVIKHASKVIESAKKTGIHPLWYLE
jgi:hypothetical protein